MIGTILNSRYELLEKIGEGGMAVVYKARCHKLNRYDAVKVLKRDYANDPAVVEKFKREATAVANLSDTNIINIFDVGTQGDIHYIVMEYVKGKTLKDVILQNVRLSYERAIDIAVQIAKALDCAHRNNIIHRDVKPQNILVTEDGVVKVTDFGIAKASSSVTITNSNKVIGSAHYFSPEQAKGTFVDARADIYSLGIVLYEMVTGKVPFDAESPVTIAIKHIQDVPVPPRQLNSNIPESLSRLIMKAIEKDPNNRYQTAREMLMDLLRLQKDLNYEIIPTAVEKDYTRVMNPVNVSSNHVDDIEDEGVDNKTKKIIIGVLAGILVLALGIVAAFAAGGFFSHKPNTGGANVTASSNIEVPNVIGFTEADAKAKIESMGLTYTRSDEASDDKIPAGSVIMTFPTAGTKLKANQEVRVRISKGPGKTTVPVLVGSDLDQAKSLITGTGFDIVVADRQYNDTAPENSIISQNPLQDTEADKGTKIQVVVSLGKKYTPAVVPDLKGKTIQQAQTILTNSKLKLGTQTPVETKDATLVGQIFSQDIAKDTKVDEQTAIKVSYYVKAANTDIVVPPLANKTLSEAQTILANLKLALGNQVSVETTDDTLVGKIFDQTPASGSTVQQGASVDVKYYVKKQQ